MNTRESRRAYFSEVQHFRQPLLWIFLLAVTAFLLYTVVSQIVFRMPVGTRPASDSLLVVIWLVFGLGFPFFFALLSLTVEVHSDGLRYRFFPLHLTFRRIAWDEVAGFEMRTYRPLGEFGGWGIRYGGGGRKAYTVAGDRGVEFHLTNGKRVLFGSARPEEFAAAVRTEMQRRD